MFKLNDTERSLIEHLDLCADEERSATAAALRLPLHKVHYALERLKDNGILKGKVAIVDYGRLGRTPYSVLLGVAPFGESERQKVARFFSDSTEVAWASEILGNPQLSFQTMAFSPSIVRELIRTLHTKVGCKITSKAVSVRHALSIYERRYLTAKSSIGQRAKIIISDPPTTSAASPVELDQIDWRCLSALTTPHDESLSSISRRLDIPIQTLHRRVNRLKESGVIKGFMSSFNFRALGIRRFKILLDTTGFDLTLEGRIEKIASSNPHVTNFAVCFGEWDYEISLECFDESAVSEILGTLGSALGTSVRSFRVLPILSYFKFSFQANVAR